MEIDKNRNEVIAV